MTQLGSLPKGHSHADQYYRMCRWYERFKKMNDGTQVGATFEGQDDDMRAFFINCDHLYDWVINDFKVGKSHPNYKEYCEFRKDLEEFKNRNECIKICADLCNSSKHFRLNKRPKFGEETRIRTEIHIDELKDNPPVKRIWRIESESGNEYDAFEIATQCVTKWKEFLENHRMQILGLMS
jgi:hypothetical protein